MHLLWGSPRKERDAAERESGLGPACSRPWAYSTLLPFAHTRSTRPNPHPPPVPLMSTILHGASTPPLARRIARYKGYKITKPRCNTTGLSSPRPDGSTPPRATVAWGEIRAERAAKERASERVRRKRRLRRRLRQLVGKHDAVQFATESSPHAWDGVYVHVLPSLRGTLRRGIVIPVKYDLISSDKMSGVFSVGLECQYH